MAAGNAAPPHPGSLESISDWQAAAGSRASGEREHESRWEFLAF